MADDAKTIEDLSRDAKAELLKAIIEAAPDAHRRGTEALESIARAFAAVSGAGPRKGDLSE